MELSPRLFWDSDPEAIDYERHARHVIERVVTRGTLEEWRAILKFYGQERVKSEVLQIRSLDERSLHFLAAFFETPIQSFRCCTEGQYSLTHSPY